MNIFVKFQSLLRLHEAIRQADAAHEKDGERYYIMPSSDGKLIIMHKRDLRLLKRKHYVNDKATTQDLIKECFYCTPYTYGDGALPPEIRSEKKAQYLSWVAAIRSIKKANKAMSRAAKRQG
jgi:hypothetical protein